MTWLLCTKVTRNRIDDVENIQESNMQSYIPLNKKKLFDEHLNFWQDHPNKLFEQKMRASPLNTISS